MAAEDAGESLDDGEMEFEDGGDEAEEEACAKPVSRNDHSPHPPSYSRNRKKYAKLMERSRAKQAAEGAGRVASRGIKPFVVELAKGAMPLELENFNASTLPVSLTGWTANPGKKLSPGLQRVWKNLETLSSVSGLQLLQWDGQYAACLSSHNMFS